jgi:hypothetical protein
MAPGRREPAPELRERRAHYRPVTRLELGPVMAPSARESFGGAIAPPWVAAPARALPTAGGVEEGCALGGAPFHAWSLYLYGPPKRRFVTAAPIFFDSSHATRQVADLGQPAASPAPELPHLVG